MPILEGLLDVLYPPSCAACDQIGVEPFCAICAEATLPAEAFTIPGVERSVAQFEFGGPVADAIRHLKYHDRPDLGRPLGVGLRPMLERLLPYDLVIPMPASRNRLIARGYDHARELVRGLGCVAEIHALLRVTEPVAQVGLDKAARAANLAAAFAPGRVSVRGRRVLLVDDVVTTGATAESAATVLTAQGAASIQLLTLARTPHPRA